MARRNDSLVTEKRVRFARTYVEGIIAALGTKEIPKVMKKAAAKMKERADGKMVNKVVRKLMG